LAFALAHEVHGRGEPLVLVHGLATTRVIWRRVLPLLERSRRVVAIDVPGFGESPAAGEGFDLEVVADDIADGLAEIGVTAPFELAGHSLGGALAIVLAERHPDAVRSLVLVAPAGLRRVPNAAAQLIGGAAERALPLRRRGAALADTPWGRRLLMSPGTKDPVSLPPAEVRAMLQASQGATRTGAALTAVAQVDLKPRLAGLKVPVGAIWGDHDRIIPPSGIETILLARGAGTPVRTIEGAGHIPMMERPEQFSLALEEILTALSRHRNIAATRTP
jgi:pimeloyl-ACP methyl ester carboxylesterase